MKKWRLTLCGLFLGSALYPLFSCADEGKKIFRWVDEKGKVHYSESLPPEQASRGGEKLNEKGMTVETLPPAKTAEQREQEARLQRLHAALIQAVSQQVEKDEVLLRTFRSVEDIEQTLQGKLNALDRLIRLVQSNRERQSAQLESLQKKAAEFERNGKPVPDKLKQDIVALRKLIDEDTYKIAQHEAQKRILQAQAQADSERFAALLRQKGKNSLRTLLLRLKDRVIPAGDPAALLIPAVPCKDAKECAALWKKAQAFIAKHAPQPHTASDTVLLSAVPNAQQPLGLLVTRLQDGKESLIFMEVLCEPSPLGQDACSSEMAQNLREDFRKALSEKDR